VNGAMRWAVYLPSVAHQGNSAGHGGGGVRPVLVRTAVQVARNRLCTIKAGRQAKHPVNVLVNHGHPHIEPTLRPNSVHLQASTNDEHEKANGPPAAGQTNDRTTEQHTHLRCLLWLAQRVERRHKRGLVLRNQPCRTPTSRGRRRSRRHCRRKRGGAGAGGRRERSATRRGAGRCKRVGCGATH